MTVWILILSCFKLKVTQHFQLSITESTLAIEANSLNSGGLRRVISQINK